jgi:beta-lactamase regulating signal transducer with metallopeptidase domain
MRTSSDLLLTFLLNACWQIPLIAAAASLGSWILKRSPARYRHWVWVSALLLSLLIPLAAPTRLLIQTVNTQTLVASTELPFSSRVGPSAVTPLSSAPATNLPTTAFTVNPVLAQAILGVYLLFLFVAAYRLIRAWSATRVIRRAAQPVFVDATLRAVISRCQNSVGSQDVEILCSESLPVPVTLGLTRPVIILPQRLLEDGDVELLTSAIAHELIHVTRRDYVLNLVYEIVYLLLSFNPLSALIRRRIKQTRELSCDELVAERVLEPQVYARSLVTLASSAPPLRRLSVTATVGIADADILEVRIMSLMNKPKLNSRSLRLLLLAVALLLVIPSVTAVVLAMRFDANAFSSAVSQEQESQQKEKEKEKLKERRRSPEFEEGVRAGQREAERKKSENYAFTVEGEEVERHREEEMKARDIRNATLMRLARIPMDQAIQIALSQQPGKVLESSLGAEHWEEPGKLAKDSFVFYHITILTGDENSPTINHVWVNAIDGTVMKNEKELPRKSREP